jgi:AraC-like DNA-binding protein
MMQFLQLVKLHYREHREVGFYADKMNLTAKYMTTLVKKASGKPAIQWIEDYVILDAKAQLSSTVNTVQQIAFDLNFPSQSLFGRYFKRAVGMSPSDYRSSLRVYQMETPV